MSWTPGFDIPYPNPGGSNNQEGDEGGGSAALSGEGPPSTTPASVGLIYIDTTADRVYVSTDTVSSADWDILPASEASGIANVVEDVTPQLGGDLDANGHTITNLDASATAKGIVELATTAEVNTGTDTVRAVTPAGLKNSALQTKVDGIEAGATADQSAAEIMAAVQTLDGPGSGLNADLLDGNEATAFATAAQGAKTDYLTVTAPTDLDAIRVRVNDLDAPVVLRGVWDASAGTFPGGGTAQAGSSYIVSVGGTVNGVVFTANDRIVAITDNASTSTYANNWHKLDYTDEVLSVAGQTGAVTLAKGDVGLGNVDNTSDANKPVSTAQQTALDLKANLASPTGTGEATWPSFKATGKTGATSGADVVLAGSTTSGAPTTGTHVAGEIVLDDTGRVYYCTVGGTPGTWVDKYQNIVTADIATHNSSASAHTAAFDAFSLTLRQFSPNDMASHVTLWDDFMGGSATSGAIGELGWTSTLSGAGSIGLPASDQSEPGYVSLQTTTLGDSSQIALDPYAFGAPPTTFIWEARYRIASLNTGGQEATHRLGLLNSAIITPADGIWFEYSAADGANWRAKSQKSGSAINNNDTTVAADNSVWVRLRIAYASGVATFSINGTTVATHSSNLPTAGIGGPKFGVTRSLGSSGNRHGRVGYFYLRAAYAR